MVTLYGIILSRYFFVDNLLCISIIEPCWRKVFILYEEFGQDCRLFHIGEISPAVLYGTLSNEFENGADRLRQNIRKTF